MIKKITYLMLLVPGFITALPALADSSRIYGQVWVGSTGAPAKGAVVSVDCPSDPSTVSSSGRYKITGLAANTKCQLRVSYQKKESLPLNVRVSGSGIRLNLELTPWKEKQWLLHKR